MTTLEAVARELDAYAGAAGDSNPAVGAVSVPVRMLVALRKALKEGTQ